MASRIILRVDKNKRANSEGEEVSESESIGPDPACISPPPRGNVEDIYKSLDHLIEERKIRIPRKYNQRPKSPKPEPAPESGNCAESTGNSKPSSSTTKVKKIKLNANVDPLSNSLATIIAASESEVSEVGNGTRARKAENWIKRPEYWDLKPAPKLSKEEALPDEIQEKIKHIKTPYRALTLLSEKGMLFELCIGRVKNDEDHVRVRRWRCLIYSGEITGVCESERKVVAREMASHEFLQNVAKVFTEDVIPKYNVPDEILIDPKVKKLVEDECQKQKREVSWVIKVVDSDMCTEYYGRVYPVYTFMCIYSIDGMEFVGYSSDEDYAKLNAAKQAYEFLTGHPFEPTKYFVDDQCSSDVEYDFSESMACQIIGKEDQIE